MYPYEIFWGLDLYVIFIAIGVIAAFVIFRVLADHNHFPVGLQNLVLVDAVISVALGYLFAVLFQAVYNAFETGVFVINSDTGATFYGGLIGGAIVMILIYFLGGKFILRNNDYKTYFVMFLQIGFCCVAIAHAFGRIGCLCAGCCHGKESDAWYAINMYMGINSRGEEVWKTVVPIQLFESIYLFLLGTIMFLLAWRGKKFNVAIYSIGYGVWRFFIEYFRADDRGATFIPFLSPSQLTAIVFILIGIAYLVCLFIHRKKRRGCLPPGNGNPPETISGESISEGSFPETEKEEKEQ